MPFQYIWGADSGELVTAVYLNGQIHPPGFPLYFLLAKLFSLIFFWLPIVKSTALVSLFFSLLTLVFLAKYIFYIQKKVFVNKKWYSKPILYSCLALLSASFLWMLYSLVPEVYMMSLFFVLTANYFLLKFVLEKKEQDHLWFWLFFFLGIFHQYIVAINFLIYLLLFRNKLKQTLFPLIKKRYLFLIAFLLLSLLPYAYSFVLILQKPILQWEEASLVGMLREILRLRYGFFNTQNNFVQSLPDKVKNLFFLLHTLNLNFTYVLWLIFAFGIYSLYKKNKAIFKVVFWSLFLYGPFLNIYIDTNLDSFLAKGIIERYHLFSFIFVVIFYVFGLIYIFELFEKKAQRFLDRFTYSMGLFGVFVILVILFPAFIFYKNARYLKLVLQDSTIENYAQNILNYPEKNSIVLLSGDLELFPAYYLHYVRNYRPDLILLSQNRMFDDFYYQNLEENFPALELPSKTDSNKLEKFIELNFKKRSIYTNQRILGLGFNYQQVGLLYKFTKDTEKKIVPTFPLSKLKVTKENYKSIYPLYFFSAVNQKYAESLFQIGDYYYSKKDYRRAVLYLSKSYFFNKDSKSTNIVYGLALYKLGRCRDSEKILLERFYNKQESEIAFALSRLYVVCFKDPKKYLFWDFYYQKLKKNQ